MLHNSTVVSRYWDGDAASTPAPEISIILPVYNEGPRLCQTLEAIRDTAGVSYQVIVINDASTDSGGDFLRADPPPLR